MATKTRSKRRNGEGGITYDEARNSYRVSITTPAGKRVFKRFKSEDEAVAWKAAQTNAINMGTFIVPSKITLGEWVVEWLTTYKKGAVKQRTYERYVSLAKHLNPLAHFPMQEMTATQVQKFYQGFPNLSACTVHKIHKLLKDMWTKAYQLELVQKNIMTNVVAPKFEKKEITIFSKDEIEKILKTCHDHSRYKKYYPMILLFVATGARRGEIMGLRWKDILFDTSEIHIRQALNFSDVIGIYTDTPKTKAAIRKIKITQEAVNELRQLKSNTVNIDIKQEKLCFVTKNDTPILPRNFEKVWHMILKNAEVEYKNLHVLRHTHATELLAAGIPIIEVARRLGHSRVSHTLELYGHAIKNYDDKIVDKVESLYAMPK